MTSDFNFTEAMGGEVTTVEGAGEARAVGPVPVKPREGGFTVGPTKDGMEVRQDPEVETGVAKEGRARMAPPPSFAPPPMAAPSGKAMWPIVCVRDSMLKNAQTYGHEGRKSKQLVSLSGIGMGSIVQEARESMRGLKEGMLILQGGGNSLRQLGPEQTTKKVMECGKQVKKKVREAVVGVLGWPKEAEGYEEIRRETNRLLQQEVLKMKMECSKQE